MMLHRHFESEKQNVTTFTDTRPVGEKEEFVSEIFPPEENQQKKRGRPRKNP